MPLPDWERALFLLVQASRSSWGDHAMMWLSGVGPWLFVLALLFTALRRQPARRATALFLASLVLIAVVDCSTSYFFKNLFHRLRPCKMPEIKALIPQSGQGCGGRWGFFSSHAANAAALAHFFSAFIRWRWIALTLWGMAALIAYSRVHLGAHLPLDVAAGFLWGGLIAQLWRALVRDAFRARGAP